MSVIQFDQDSAMLPMIYIVDDDPAVSKALESVGEYLRVPVRCFSSGDQFLSNIPLQPCGCLILDLMLEGQSGMDVLRRLRELGYQLPVIVISGHATVSLAVEAMQLQALTVLEKPFRLAELKEKIETAFQEDVANRAVLADRDEARRRFNRLTVREREVLQLVARGFSNKQIAADLGLSLRAIEDRRSRLMKRLEAKSVADALLLLQRAELDHDLSAPPT